jgi:hypothetical protein
MSGSLVEQNRPVRCVDFVASYITIILATAEILNIIMRLPSLPSHALWLVLLVPMFYALLLASARFWKNLSALAN